VTHSQESTPQKATPTNIRYWVLAAFCAAAAIGYLQRYSINFLAEPIQRELDLDKTEMGWAMSGFFWTYAILSLPAGWIVDRWGSRRALALNALLWSVAVAGMAFAGDLSVLVVTWSVAGAAQAGLFPGAVIGLRKWLPATRRAFASGMLSSFMSVGAVLAPLVAGALLDWGHFSWRQIFLWLSLPGMTWAVVYYCWYRDLPAEHTSVNDSELALIAGGNDAEPAHATRAPWLHLALSVRMWLICAQHFFRAAAQVFFGTWFATFLRESPGISAKHVAVLSSLPPLVLILGATCGGIVSDWLLQRTGSRRVSRQALAVVNMLLCAAMFVAAAVSDDPRIRIALICAGCFWMAMGGVSSYTITMDLGGPYVGTVFSAMNMCGSFGAAAFPLYAGWLVETTQNWNYVLLSIAVIYLAAAACWAGLNPEGSLFDAPAAKDWDA
jgi:MFS family permease